MKFRFETILRINKNKEDLLLKELGTINSHLQKQEDRKQFMGNAADSSKKELSEKLRTREMNADTLALYNNFFIGIRLQDERQQNIITEIHTRLAAKRKEVVEAGKKRRIMEILKERDFMKAKKLENKKENAMMDEIASNMWQRNI